MSKDRFVSKNNLLKIPIEYNVDSFKKRKSDATKLICAVRNFYKHQNLVDDGFDPMDETNPIVARRKQIKDTL